ncbi:MAG: OmpA family protein, partial [Cyclobacteriaceae bacterium]|nr:OmpA family protein [Cyclobacteriaceae bacterium]
DIEDYYNISEFEDYFQSNSGKVLISAINRSDSKGDQDLYVSFRTGENSWSKPENLGSVINTSKIEYSPFLASDNKTLYFSSNGHSGFGESDIFFSKKLDDTWTNWSFPINLGESINSVNWDGYYTISAKGDYAYFISTSGTVNEADFDPDNEDIYRISLAKEAQPGPVVMISGTVLNTKTNKPLKADIFYESVPTKDEEGMASTDPENGNYKIALPAGKKYNIRAEVDGYIAFNRYEDFTMIDEYTEITKDLDLTPMIIDETIELKNILFALNKADLLPESLPELEQLVALLNENNTLEIGLNGHTDNTGTASINLKLSESRALAVMNYLLQNGIDKNRLGYAGYGETRPITDNDSPESREKNRRVEIKVLKI